ncbi:hypothetical protein EVAR_41795_1 [Eumeta japonica]|uniref:Uncharacterized protein n=1 Tax=Eumeta variegata TaxID=151549 RepID=A0A4C1VY31_EUMVA|nr:hypothetical protein EVAR_41795_1 [Eumeta japonica]
MNKKRRGIVSRDGRQSEAPPAKIQLHFRIIPKCCMGGYLNERNGGGRPNKGGAENGYQSVARMTAAPCSARAARRRRPPPAAGCQFVYANPNSHVSLGH